MTPRLTLVAAAIAVQATVPTAAAQTPPADRAVAAIARGDLRAASAVYDSVLTVHPDDAPTLVARGHVLSWLGEHDRARADFGRVLRADSGNLSAWLGLGYASAWSGQWDAADSAFGRAAVLAPETAEPAKGRAYVALWRGDREAAIAAFEDLTVRYPADPEPHAGLGTARLADGQRGAARAAFERALRLDPGRADARDGREATRFLPAALEVTAWGGYTRFADAPAGANGLGLRSAQLALQANPAVRLWVGYDDGLALDNPALAASGSHAPWLTSGGYVSWGRAFGTKLEGGWRDLGTESQWTAAVEQVAVLPSGVAFKASGWSGFRSDDRVEWVVGAGVSVPASRRVRLELLGYASGNGLPDEDGYRGLVSGSFRFPTGLELGAGVAAGRTAIDLTGTGSLVEGHVTARIPVGAQRLLLQARHQVVEQGADFTAFALGLTLALWER